MTLMSPPFDNVSRSACSDGTWIKTPVSCRRCYLALMDAYGADIWIACWCLMGPICDSMIDMATCDSLRARPRIGELTLKHRPGRPRRGEPRPRLRNSE